MYQKKKIKKGFSKKLLIADYVIAVILVIVFLICVFINGTYTMDVMNEMVEMGTDASMISIAPPFNLDIFSIFLSTWIIQLGVSSGAYYVLVKSEHKIQLPMQLVNDLPQDIKDRVDMNQIITTVLTSTDN